MGDHADDMEAMAMQYMEAREFVEDEVAHRAMMGFWKGKDGKLYRISETSTTHLLNIEKMLTREGLSTPQAILLELEYRRQQVEEKLIR